MAEHIPTINLADPDFAAKMIEACETSGFFAVTGHEISTDLFDAMRFERSWQLSSHSTTPRSRSG